MSTQPIKSYDKLFDFHPVQDDFFQGSGEIITTPLNNSVPVEHIEWSENDIEKLRKVILQTTIRNLSDNRCSQVLKNECIAWVVSNDMHPFSFLVCYKSEELDYQFLRNKILFLLGKKK